MEHVGTSALVIGFADWRMVLAIGAELVFNGVAHEFGLQLATG